MKHEALLHDHVGGALAIREHVRQLALDVRLFHADVTRLRKTLRLARRDRIDQLKESVSLSRGIGRYRQTELEHLQMAREHVERSHALVFDQRARVADLERAGQETTAARQLLATLEESLEVMSYHLALEEEHVGAKEE